MRPVALALPAILLLTLFLIPAEARADGVVIQGGSLTFSGSDTGTFSFQGDGISLNGLVDHRPSLCVTCRAGEQANASLYRVGLDIRGGSGVIGGVSYDRLLYESQLRFTTDSFTLPDDDSPLVSITVPFTFEGFMQGCTESVISGPCPGGWVFSTLMSGQGLATLQLSSFLDVNGNRAYSFHSLTYNFGPPTATPEPATLLLLGTGLAGVAARMRRRGRTKSDSTA